jgi:hypothetical protein
MDSSRFAKLCRDCKVIDKKCTLTDVDIVFSRFKVDRKLTFDQFTKVVHLTSHPQAFAELADIKYAKPGSIGKLVAHVALYDGPVTRCTRPSSGGVFDKLTDTSLYTGSHKHRFDAEGRGQGLEGRVDQESRTQSLSQLVDRSLSISGSPKKPTTTGKKPTTPKTSSLPDVFSRLTDSKSYKGICLPLIR